MGAHLERAGGAAAIADLANAREQVSFDRPEFLVGDLTHLATQFGLEVRQRFMGLTRTLPPRLVGLTAGEISEVIDQVVRAHLTALSRCEEEPRPEVNLGRGYGPRRPEGRRR